MAMTIHMLLKAVKDTVVTEDDVKRLNARLDAAEKQFEEKERREAIGYQDFLNFQYTL